MSKRHGGFTAAPGELPGARGGDAPARVRGQPTDDTLVALARDGDTSAFALLIRRHDRRVFRVARAHLRDANEAEDVVQQAYLAAFVHIDQFAGTAPWSTWLCRIAANEALASNKRGRRHSSQGQPWCQAESHCWCAAGPDPERVASGRELRRLVAEEIERLTEPMRAVLVMRQVDGMSTAEVATVLAVAEEVVKTRLHRARTCLRDRIERRIGGRLAEANPFGSAHAPYSSGSRSTRATATASEPAT